MGFRIFVSGSGIAEDAKQALLAEGCLIETGDPSDTPEDLAQKLRTFNPDGIIARQGKFTPAVLNAAKALKVISKHGVGTDTIDIDAATERSIPVFITPGINSESAAEHTLALILSLSRRIPHQDRRIRKGVFEKKSYDGFELSGKTLGIIGFGRIGKRLSELVAPFHMNVLIFDPVSTADAHPPCLSKVSTLDDIFPTSDIISLHCPLTPATKGIINQGSIAQMKNSVCIINVARGGLIIEEDLCSALENGQIGGAALDVFEVEPLSKGNPLLALDNVIVTSHVGGISDTSFKNMGLKAAQNVLAVLRGEPIDLEALVNNFTATQQ